MTVSTLYHLALTLAMALLAMFGLAVVVVAQLHPLLALVAVLGAGSSGWQLRRVWLDPRFVRRG